MDPPAPTRRGEGDRARRARDDELLDAAGRMKTVLMLSHRVGSTTRRIACNGWSGHALAVMTGRDMRTIKFAKC